MCSPTTTAPENQGQTTICAEAACPVRTTCATIRAVSAELEVLQDAIARLESAGIAYMLTGSVALSYYAEPRMTRDVDLVVALAGLDPKSIVALFAPDYYIAEADVGRAIAARSMFNVLHLGKVVKLDFIVRKDTPYRRREFERRKAVQMPGFEAWIVSREDLILSKLAWAKESGSELQLRDVGALLAAGADEAYLRACAGELSVAALLETCLNGRHDS